MGRAEASHPPRHSSRHLHRNRSHDRRDYYDTPLDDRPRLKHRRKRDKDDLVLAGPRKPSHAQPRYDVVENWLEQNAKQRPHPEPKRSERHHDQVRDHGRPPRPRNTTSPYNKHSSGADPGWRPRHAFPGHGTPQLASAQELGLTGAKKATRRWTAPSDSSFISGFENSSMPLKHDPEFVQGGYGNISRVGPLGEAGLEHLGASSTTSHTEKPVNFEKGQRRRTREDKYETGKKKRHREEGNDAGHGDPPKKKHRRSERKKSMMSSKNVMNNFTSGAVLNDRITMQPHLKPGLFDNGRASKKQPISDLAFSEMQFLKHQKRNQQPKTLSRSRLREKQREDREMEEVSTFFLPPRPDGNSHKPRRQSSGTHTDRLELGHPHLHLEAERSRELSQSPSSSSLTRPRYYQVLRHETIGTSIPDLHEYIDGQHNSDKNTTYYTWSSSRHSPRLEAREERTSPNVSGSVWTSTPEPIRREIIATGVFRDTGIPVYDDGVNEQAVRKRTAQTSLTNARALKLQEGHHDLSQRLEKPQIVKYRDQAMMTDDIPTHLGRPERDSLTPGSRHEGGVESAPLDNHMRKHQQEPSSHENAIQQTPNDALGVDRQRIVRETRLAPIEKDRSQQNSQPSSVLNSQDSLMHQSPKPVSTEASPGQANTTQDMSDGGSVASREAMPPPLIPASIYSSTSMAQRSVPAAHASTKSIYSPEQSSSLNRAASAARRISSAEGYNGDKQHLYETGLGCNTAASASATCSDIGRALPSVDTLTWIPQRVPSARIIGSRSVPPGSRMNPPIYANQLQGDSSRDPYRGDSVSKPRMSESLAEFIAKIESESQLQSYTEDYDTIDSELGQDEIASHAHLSTPDVIYGRPPAYCAEEQTHPKTAGNLRFSDTDLGDVEDFPTEVRHSQYEDGGPGVSSTVAKLVEDLGEYSEMTNFWRPNQFSWF
ncbi:hypothetical protein GGR52DRAFT_540901 [Hypoxylon sp. FL1284]|nr:hypothetical protein GGR52DRAFT_540901 [Hypoxylon sp. FL1284]